MIYSQDKLLPWAQAAIGHLDDINLFDAHVHLGIHDPAGLEAVEEEAVEALEQVGSRALVFPLKEPSGYREYNQHMVELAERRPERFRALCRLDPADDPLAELERCLDAGAVGLKLHPRGEGFEIGDERLDRVFAAADERRLPIMIHAGVGDPAVGTQTLERAERHPDARFILAHCAVGAFEQAVPRARDLFNVYFDTSWWNPADLWALLRMVRPCQILYASDIPFGGPAEAIVLTARLAIQAGLDDEQLRSVMGGQLQRLVDHDEPLFLGDAPDDVEALAPELERLYVTLCTAVEPMLRGEDPGQGLELARAAASDPHGPYAEIIASVASLLELAEGREDADPLRPLRTPGFDLVLAAAVVARTPLAAVPAQDQIGELSASP
jgi:predicted TIM-barrel fold metal-dependent hydrolase